MSIPIRYLSYSLIIVLLQVMLFKHMALGTTIDPYIEVIIYPLLLIILPVNSPSGFVVLLGFICGMIIDYFYSTPGVHTSALVFTAFIRKFILNIVEPRTGYAVEATPLEIRTGGYWYYSFAAILLFLHILIYNLVSFFSFTFMINILFKTLITFSISMLLIALHGMIWRSLR